MIKVISQAFRYLTLGAGVVFLSSCTPDERDSQGVEFADLILKNAQVLPLTGEDIVYEAIAIKDGRILSLGSNEEVLEHKTLETSIRNLGGQTVMPGFFQAHAHFNFLAIKNSVIDLDPPPGGKVASLDQLIDTMKVGQSKNPKAPMLLGMGYDDTAIEDGRHPTRQDLDQISTQIPVAVLHISGHLASLNSVVQPAALFAASKIGKHPMVFLKKPPFNICSKLFRPHRKRFSLIVTVVLWICSSQRV